MLGIFVQFSNRFFYWLFRNKANSLNQFHDQEIWLFDIDNTLADTGKALYTIGKYPGFLAYFSIYRLANPIIKITHLASKKDKKLVYYISVRSYWYFFTTLDWLKKWVIRETETSQIIFVETVEAKLDLIEKLLAQNNDIHYIDDLSYNHENRSIRFYEEAIHKLKKMPITYYGIDFIENDSKN